MTESDGIDCNWQLQKRIEGAITFVTTLPRQ